MYQATGCQPLIEGRPCSFASLSFNKFAKCWIRCIWWLNDVWWFYLTSYYTHTVKKASIFLNFITLCNYLIIVKGQNSCTLYCGSGNYSPGPGSCLPAPGSAPVFRRLHLFHFICHLPGFICFTSSIFICLTSLTSSAWLHQPRHAR